MHDHHRHSLCQHVQETYWCSHVSVVHNFETVRGGVGFGIYHRAFFSSKSRDPTSNELELWCDGSLTLIQVCRNKQRVEAARAKLCIIADKLVRHAKRSPDYAGCVEIFKNRHIAIHTVDLADIVFRFADEITQN